MRYDLANRVENLIKQYVIFDNDLEATAVTLWVFGTYLMDKWQLWPKLYIYSPERNVAKPDFYPLLKHCQKMVNGF